MTEPSATPVEGGLDEPLRLQDLVDRSALGDLCESVYALFGIPVRIYASDNQLLADARHEHEVCAYVNTLTVGRLACGAVVGAVKSLDPGDLGDVVHPCFTGAAYRIIGIDYDQRPIGRMILGPFLPNAVTEAPPSLLGIDPRIDSDRAKSLLFNMPRARTETISRIATHLKATLDLIFFSGHKTLLTSQMHLASVRESYHMLQETNASLQHAYDRLRELDRLKSSFLATVSHELRTPLTSIIGYSEMLGEGMAGPLSDEQGEFVRTIHEKGEHLLRLITSLLDLSKLEIGTMRVHKKRIILSTTLSEVLSTIAPTAHKKGVELRRDFPGELPPIEADPERLRQVFVNLVDNAVKFTPKGGHVTVRAHIVEAATSGGDDDDDGIAILAPVRTEVEVRVEDTGIGIPEIERERVFDAFYQVDSSSTREYGGTGLGLSIAHRLIDAHGGSVRIESNEPNGTIFVVRFPIASSLLPPMQRS